MTQIQIVLADNIIRAELSDTATSRDFLSLLPLQVVLNDYASTEKVTELPKPLSTQGAAPGYEPVSGDITYYAPWGNLAIFYRDFGYASGLVYLGRIIEGATHLNFRGAQKATIMRVTPGN